jgi:hypothetical protein
MQLIPTATDANFILDKIRPGTASTLSHLVVCFNFYYFFLFCTGSNDWRRGEGGGVGQGGGTLDININSGILSSSFFLRNYR